MASIQRNVFNRVFSPPLIRNDGPPLHICYGPFGSGKSWYMSAIGLKDMEDTNIKQVGANFPIVHPVLGPCRHFCRDDIRDGKPISFATLLGDEWYNEFKVGDSERDMSREEMNFYRTLRHMQSHFYMGYQTLESCPPWLLNLCKDFIKLRSWQFGGRVFAIKAYHWDTKDRAKSGYKKTVKQSELFINLPLLFGLWGGSKKFKKVYQAYDTHWYRTKKELELMDSDGNFEPVQLDTWDVGKLVKRLR